ncbi:MAG: nitrous oxide reductase family maturation protein NosD [Gemmatimonadota bacterium]|nr:nitrous oxide reductase family maturation protein NosD [Gemmatimonadota bacterium]
MNLVPLLLAAQATLTVGASGDYASITEALRAAAPGDTIVVQAGVYREHLEIEHPVVLLGQDGAIIDGDRQGIVLTVLAPATIEGFTVRGSGAVQSTEDAGLLAENAADLRIAGNRFEDVLFGIYLKNCPGAVIADNEIAGKPIPIPLRGDGIRLWYSPGGIISGNTVWQSRDVVIWFSDSTTTSDNVVTESRYGLHYMYSHENVFERNRFEANDVGAFIMYSHGITFRENVFANARGTSGRGLGFKDSDDIRAVGNVMVKNAVGISIDNSPSSDRSVNVFARNVVAYNDVGISMLPSVARNTFEQNEFIDNVTPVAVTGGGTALGNRWAGNYWSEYEGFDADGDDRGDTPFVFERLSDDLLMKHAPLRVFSLSPAAASLNVLSRAFPLLRPEAIVIDSTPRIGAPEPIDTTDAPAAPSLFAAFMLFGVASGAAGLAVWLGRPLGGQA